MCCSLVPRVDAADILGAEIAVVESIVAFIHESCSSYVDIQYQEILDS